MLSLYYILYYGLVHNSTKGRGVKAPMLDWVLCDYFIVVNLLGECMCVHTNLITGHVVVH